MLTNVYCNFLGIFIVLVILGGIQGHPRKQAGNRSSIKDDATSQEALHQVNESDEKIIFPTDSPSSASIKPSTSTPSSVDPCEDSLYCENPPLYPADFIKNALKTRPDLQLLSSLGEVAEIAERVDADGGERSLCSSLEEIVYPKSGKNREQEKLYIINEVDFPQGVKIQKCMAENTACETIDGFATGYVTFCKQLYAYKPLASVKSDETGLDINLFSFPTSCCCYYKNTGNPMVRFGGDDEEMTPAIKMNVHKPKGSEHKKN